MAIMKGVFTSISGRVGNTIYCKSGPNQIIKTAFIPGNPKTKAQTTDRNLFASLNSEFKILNDELVQPFWKPFMTASHKAWSSFLSANKNNMFNTFDLTKVILTKGSLETVPIDYVAFDETAKTLDVNWNSNTLQNGSADDDVSLVVFDHDSNILLYYNLKCAVRSDSHFLITLLDSFTGYNLSVYAFSSIDSASGLTISQVSNSTSFDIGDYGLVMSFVDNAADTSTIQLKDLDDNACKVDWGDGNLQVISTSAETESLITPTFVKIYSRNSLSYFKTTNNNFCFNVSILPCFLIYLEVYGSNTIFGYLTSLPSSLLTLRLSGGTVITGDVSGFPSYLSSIVLFSNNTCFGDFSDLPSFITKVLIGGQNKINDYRSPRVWSNNMDYVQLLPIAGFGLDSTEVDNLLIDLSGVVTWIGSKIINISGNNEARTAASDAAVATLQGKGVTVTTN